MKMRMVERDYGSVAGFIAAAQANALRLAQDGAGSAGASAGTVLGVWVDDSRQGLFLRLLRDNEMASATWSWRPHRAFPLNRVADDACDWLAQYIRGIV